MLKRPHQQLKLISTFFLLITHKQLKIYIYYYYNYNNKNKCTQNYKRL